MSEEKPRREIIIGDGASATYITLLFFIAGMILLSFSVHNFIQPDKSVYVYGLTLAGGLLSMFVGMAVAAKGGKQ